MGYRIGPLFKNVLPPSHIRCRFHVACHPRKRNKPHHKSHCTNEERVIRWATTKTVVRIFENAIWQVMTENYDQDSDVRPSLSIHEILLILYTNPQYNCNCHNPEETTESVRQPTKSATNAERI